MKLIDSIYPIKKEIVTSDGYKLAANVFTPLDEVKGLILIVPAMGAQQKYYADFASFLAGNGFMTVTFDYRGIGASRRGSLRGFYATILDWANKDCATMIDATEAIAPGKPLYWIGHSLGGQILPFVPNLYKVHKVISVNSGSGYWLSNAFNLRWRVGWLWFVAVPIALFVCGYFPGKRLRKVGDLPKGVVLQWRCWCLDKDYAAGAERARLLFYSVRVPIVSFSVTDDEFMSQRSIESLLELFPNAPKTNIRFSPADIGEKKVGHFGFFKKQFENSLWRNYFLPEIQDSNKKY